MTNINTQKLINTCDHIGRISTRICGGHHGSAWLFNKLMRYFESEKAALGVTIPVFLNVPIMCDGEVYIERTGHYEVRYAQKGD